MLNVFFNSPKEIFMKNIFKVMLMLFLGVLNSFEINAEQADDSAPSCSKYSNSDDNQYPANLKYVKECRKAGCMFNFNSTDSKDYTGECVEFVEADCSSLEASDCKQNPQCVYEHNTCKTNKKCSGWGTDTKMCNRHNDANGTPCQPNTKKRCALNEGGAKPN
jgi:hypothetical protein